MRTAIIISKKDPASLNIKDCLLEKYNFREINNIYTLGDIDIYTIEEESIYANNIDKKIKADLFIFASKHESNSKINSLSVHVPGNWSKAELGGKDRKLCVAPASLIKKAFNIMNELNNTGYEVTLEPVHHGPYLEKPAMFIEIGSTEEAWKSKRAGNIIAKTIYRTLSSKTHEYRTAIGIGGTHYPHTFNRIMLETDIAIGIICPKYHLSNLDEEMFSQAIKKTLEKIDFILLDWKGLGQYKQKVLDLVKEAGLPYERTDKIK